MRGLFEHQFLSFKKKHMLNLIAMARADGKFHKKELEVLYKIGRKYELKPRHVDDLLALNKLPEPVKPANHDKCMEQLYDLVEMMLADGVIEKTEIEFCLNFVRKFGYKESLLEIMINYIQSEIKDHESWKVFKQESMALKISIEI
ncbi:hypothetical protein BH23BAC1_BH23BAC1_10430 [soil metagenome]